MNEIIQYVNLFRLPSFISITPLRCTYVVEYIHNFFSLLCYVHGWLYHSLIHSPSESRLGFFQSSAIVHKAVLKRSCSGSYINTSFHFPRVMPMSGITRSHCKCLFNFIRDAKLFSRGAVLVYIPISSV